MTSYQGLTEPADETGTGLGERNRGGTETGTGLMNNLVAIELADDHLGWSTASYSPRGACSRSVPTDATGCGRWRGTPRACAPARRATRGNPTLPPCSTWTRCTRFVN